jgi:hypothetical protein
MLGFLEWKFDRLVGRVNVPQKRKKKRKEELYEVLVLHLCLVVY